MRNPTTERTWASRSRQGISGSEMKNDTRQRSQGRRKTAVDRDRRTDRQSDWTYAPNQKGHHWFRCRLIEERIRFEDDLVILVCGCIEKSSEIGHCRQHHVFFPSPGCRWEPTHQMLSFFFDMMSVDLLSDPTAPMFELDSSVTR